jgi:hypothetical protein
LILERLGKEKYYKDGGKWGGTVIVCDSFEKQAISQLD